MDLNCGMGAPKSGDYSGKVGIWIRLGCLEECFIIDRTSTASELPGFEARVSGLESSESIPIGGISSNVLLESFDEVGNRFALRDAA